MTTSRSLLAEIEGDWQFVEATPESEPSWFALLMVMRAPDHERMARFCRGLDENRVGNRRLFGGNLLWQPAYRDAPHRVHATLEHTDHMGLGGVFLGVYPGLTDEMVRAQAAIVIRQWKRG